jgi:probable rRNA maturation factor
METVPGARPNCGRPRPEDLSTQPACSIDVDDATGRLPAELLGWIADRAGAAAANLECSGEVRVRIVGDAEMSAAHERHLGDPSTTDVMTFDMADGAAERTRALDADVLICLDEAARQATLRKHAVQLEVLLYLVHAMLHCLGYDDQTRAGSRAMHEREDQVLSAIGVGVVYHAGENGRGPGSRGGDGGAGTGGPA